MKQHVIPLLELLKLNPPIMMGAVQLCCTHRIALCVFLFPEADSHPNTRKRREEGIYVSIPDDALQWVGSHL